MPENEKPPAMRVDFYLLQKDAVKPDKVDVIQKQAQKRAYDNRREEGVAPPQGHDLVPGGKIGGGGRTARRGGGRVGKVAARQDNVKDRADTKEGYVDPEDPGKEIGNGQGVDPPQEKQCAKKAEDAPKPVPAQARILRASR